MRRISLAVLAFVLFIASAAAASFMKSTMRGWKGDLESAETMLRHDRIDAAQWRGAFAGISAQARDLSAQLTASTAERRDMAARFLRLSEAADRLAAPAAANAPGIAALRQQCRSCHDLYAN